MSSQIPTRDAALALLKNDNTSESLIKHPFAVESVMRYMAKKFGEDKDTWGVVGLIHDLDMGMREVAVEIGLKGSDQ